MSLVNRLLRKNTSMARVAGFVVSNFIGLAIVLGALQFYLDARGIWEADDSFISTDYMVINKKVTGAALTGGDTGFSEAEIADVAAQPWVRKVGRFYSNDFKVNARVGSGQRRMSTYMFFEAIPDEFIDVPRSQWHWDPESDQVPIIISKDYLTLYNFGFASSAGLPQMSEGVMSGIPLTLELSDEKGIRSETRYGYIAGYSNRLNTILVPLGFLESENRLLGSGARKEASRLILDVSSPGDVQIAPYLEAHGYEVAGDKSGSQAAFLLKVITAIVMVIGAVITLLSFFILLLSVSLIMEKNRGKLHGLLMLGYDLRVVGRPYVLLVSWASAAAFLLAMVGVTALRLVWSGPLEGLGSHSGGLWLTLLAGVVLTALIIIFNIASVRKRVRSAWRM